MPVKSYAHSSAGKAREYAADSGEQLTVYDDAELKSA
jgi:hypothetical protein